MAVIRSSLIFDTLIGGPLARFMRCAPKMCLADLQLRVKKTNEVHPGT